MFYVTNLFYFPHVLCYKCLEHVLWWCRHLRREEAVQEEASRSIAALSSGPKLDLGFKEGQTITINMPVSTLPCALMLLVGCQDEHPACKN